MLLGSAPAMDSFWPGILDVNTMNYHSEMCILYLTLCGLWLLSALNTKYDQMGTLTNLYL